MIFKNMQSRLFHIINCFITAFNKIQNKKNIFYKIKQNMFNCFKKKHSQVAILIATPCAQESPWWGDYHFALSMSKEFKKYGLNTEIRFKNQWDQPFLGKIVIVLRGLSRYNPKKQHINIMWNISHPELVDNNEYEEYDIVFIPSKFYAKILKKVLNTSIFELLQCTDPNIFNEKNNKKTYDIIFVGNTRGVYRNSVRYIMYTKYKFGLWGRGWEKFIDQKYISGQNYNNSELGFLYNSSKFIANDHWDDMRKFGYISNRVFDGFAAGSFVVTDYVEGIEKIFPKLKTYKVKKDFIEILDFYMNNEKERRSIIDLIQKEVLKNHTFSNRVLKIIACITKSSISKINGRSILDVIRISLFVMFLKVKFYFKIR